jgi:hypothetical protein
MGAAARRADAGGMRSHLSASNVLALAALFIALGGSSYAAVKLKANSVTSRTVKDGSLLRRDFKAGVLPAASRVVGTTGAAGPAGPQGEHGEKGENGEKGAPGERGPSEAQSVYRYGSGGQLAPVDVTVATLDLQPGAYLVEAKLSVAAVGKFAGVICTLHAGQAKDQVLGDAVGALSLSSHLTTTLATPATATLTCSAAGVQPPLPKYGNVRLTAVRLGQETSTSV